MRLNGPVLRDTLLAKRWKQSELLAHGLIDEMVPEAKVLERSIEVATREGAKMGSGTWGAIKVGLLRAARSGASLKGIGWEGGAGCEG